MGFRVWGAGFRGLSIGVYRDVVPSEDRRCTARGFEYVRVHTESLRRILGGAPREQKMLTELPPRVVYHEVY